MQQVHSALTIAGSDSSGGAGIQADLKTFTALGVYGASVITALTAQNTRGVTGIHGVPADFIEAQFAAVASDLDVRAIKTGMLGDAATVETVASLVASAANIPVIVDPVMVATSGDQLLRPDAVDAVIQKLLPLATLATPNLHEAAKLLRQPFSTSLDETERQAVAILSLGPAAVLIKGGHGDGDFAVDILATSSGLHRYSRPRVETRNTHGTGCTLSAAVAAFMVKGYALAPAVAAAKTFVWHALASGAGLRVGAGNGPLDHLYNIKTESSAL